MSRFSQLNGHLPLPHGKADGLLADWSVCAFSQLNTLQSCTCIRAGSPTPSLRPFSQLNVCVAPELARHQAKPLTSASAPDAKAFSQLNAPRVSAHIPVGSRALSRQPFSQLNAWSTPGLIRHLPKATLSSAALEGRVFSQLNAGVHTPLGKTQKDAFSEEAFSQLNALGRQSNSHPRAAACSQPQPVRRRPSFRDLKRRAYLHTAHEPRTTRGSVHLEPEIWRNRMK